jgi:hypothetical protein
VARPSRPDAPTLAAGIGLLVLGGLVLLDQLGQLDLRFGALAPVTVAVVGTILLAAGLTRER